MLVAEPGGEERTLERRRVGPRSEPRALGTQLVQRHGPHEEAPIVRDGDLDLVPRLAPP